MLSGITMTSPGFDDNVLGLFTGIGNLIHPDLDDFFHPVFHPHDPGPVSGGDPRKAAGHADGFNDRDFIFPVEIGSGFLHLADDEKRLGSGDIQMIFIG